MTKKELEEKNKALRAELDKAHEELAELKKEKKELGVMDKSAVGGFFDKDTRQWNLVELNFNAETGEAEVSKVKKVGNDLAMFTYEIKEFIRTEITMRSIR